MDQKQSSLEEKISKMAEHSESLNKPENAEPVEVSPEAKAEQERKEREITKPLVKKELPSPKAGKTTSPLAVKAAKDLKELDKENQIKSLVSLSFTKGIYFAVDVARNLDDPYLLDELRSRLISQFEELVKSKKIKQI